MTAVLAVPSRPAGAFIGLVRNRIRQNAYCVWTLTLAPGSLAQNPRCGFAETRSDAAFLPLAPGFYPRLASTAIDSRGDNDAAETITARAR